MASWVKYHVVLRMLNDYVNNLDPNAATAEEMEDAFESIPGVLEKLKQLYEENH